MRHSRLRFARRRRARLVLVACALAASGCASPLAWLPGGFGGVEGEIRIRGRGESVEKLGPVVVYLRPHASAPQGAGTLTLFDDRADERGQELVVITRGQSLRFVSRSGVAHRLFALRGEERLDVGVPENGESRVVPMERAGWIRFYCSLHQDENWDVFVSPSPHFARLGLDGRYRIEHLPRGDYELSIWSAAIDGPVRLVTVGFWTSTLEPVWLDPAKLRP